MARMDAIALLAAVLMGIAILAVILVALRK
jgi:hypothetical protein